MSRQVEIVAELGINHLGDMMLAAKMIRTAKDCGADVAKFQIYSPEKILDPEHPTLKPWWNVILETELDYEKVVFLKKVCDEAGIEFLASVFEPEKVAWTEAVGMQRYKIASRSVKNTELIEAIQRTGKPILASYPYGGHEFTYYADLLYCIPEYPVPLDKLQFWNEDVLDWPPPSIFPYPFKGFSDHTVGITASVVAMSLGAEIIEKHFTLSRSLPGPDQVCSIEPDELRQLCRMRDDIEVICGHQVL